MDILGFYSLSKQGLFNIERFLEDNIQGVYTVIGLGRFPSAHIVHTNNALFSCSAFHYPAVVYVHDEREVILASCGERALVRNAFCVDVAMLISYAKAVSLSPTAFLFQLWIEVFAGVRMFLHTHTITKDDLLPMRVLNDLVAVDPESRESVERSYRLFSEASMSPEQLKRFVDARVIGRLAMQKLRLCSYSGNLERRGFPTRQIRGVMEMRRSMYEKRILCRAFGAPSTAVEEGTDDEGNVWFRI